MALWLKRESPLLAHLCVSPQIYRTTLRSSTHCEINRNLSHAHSLSLCQVESGHLGRGRWHVGRKFGLQSSRHVACSVRGNECRALPTMSLVPALSCFRPSHRIIHTGLRHVHAHGKSYHGRKISFQQAHVFGLFRRASFFASTNDGLTLMLST